ncbi:AAA family ATPase [Ancylothrix sp. C2]|uniref:adenylate/guanylate cyclase domain-containing protein n=1 Tax=Ancylothrix sp. D3o TaxID=2953691 RepID=UPI0021BA5A42|nr:adenylate/guanylate cyclase domain-containing protein [Ancylothrix sp. D3o]MCT7949594.1 AAA family ATPase [Ancylothrix sp. D3o]
MMTRNSPMPTLLETLASFMPFRVLSCFAADPIPLKSPKISSLNAAVLFADISGFTSLTERLAQKGSAGVEELTKHLNAYFGQLIELITAHEGDIVKFAGDAMLAIWPAETLSLEQATFRAAQCALAILNDLGEYKSADAQLQLHIGIGAGELKEFYTGGSADKWEYFVAGEPIAQVASAEIAAGTGEACISLPAWKLIKHQFNGSLLESNVVRLEGFNYQASVVDRSILDLPKSPEISLNKAMETRLKRYINMGVLQRLEAGQTQWLGELRRVSVMFLNLPGIDYNAPNSLDFITEILTVIQNVLTVYEGTLNKFLVDDKGSTLVIGLGLPPFSHGDDAVRCVTAGMAILEKLRKLGLKPKIGITTGICYSGVIGCDKRREYTIIGAVVNLSARLMQAANDGILCDERTFERAKEKINFETLTPIKVKGRDEAVAVFVPTSFVVQDRPWWMSLETQKNIVGREKERALLAEKLQQLKAGASGVMLISGEAGIGKSCLIENLLLQAQDLGLGTLTGAGDAIDQSKPYHAWNGVFNQLLDLTFLATPEAKKQQVLELLEDEAELLEKAALLNGVLQLDLPDTEVTAGLVGQQRAEATRDLLVQLLQDSVNRSPKLLVIEDAHWLDSSSWALVLAVSKNVKRLLLVIGTRPMGEPVPVEYEELLRVEGVEQLHLEAMHATDTREMLCQRLGVKSLPDEVVELIEKKAEGNPFFSEELLYGLREAGVIEIHHGECRIAPGVGNLDELRFPETVQGVIAERIDRLSPNEQLTLKVASVIGRSFGFRMLREIHPIEDDKLQLPTYLTKLEKFDLTPMETPEPELAYTFKHIITQEVAYGMMLYSQRRQVHETLALWYERSYEDLSGFYSVLAHHWSQARVAEKAIFYLEKAGEQAVRAHALREALQLFTEALDWLETLPDTLERKEQELRLQIALGSPLMAIRGYGAVEVKATYDRARELCQQVGQESQLFSILNALAVSYCTQSDFPASLELCKQLEALAQSTQEQRLFPLFSNSYTFNFFHLGEFNQARYYAELGIATYQPENHEFYMAKYAQDPAIGCFLFDCMANWFLGYPEVATQQSKEIITLAQKLSHPFSLAYGFNCKAWLALYSKQVSKALQEADGLMAVAVENEFPFFIMLSNLIRAWVAIQLDQPEEAINQIEETLKLWKSVGAVLARHCHLTFLAEGYAKAGKPAAALEILAECVDEIERTKECFFEAEVYRLKGQFLLDLNQVEEAEQSYLKSIEVARRQEAKSLELRASISLCSLWQQQGKTIEAKALLSEIYGWFTQGFDMPDLIAAQQLLRELS